MTDQDYEIKMAEFDLQESAIEQQQKSIRLQELQIVARRQAVVEAYKSQGERLGPSVGPALG